MWGVFWLPLRWFDSEGVGGAWVSLIFNAMALASALPWLLRREAWRGFVDQLVNGLLLGTAFSLYTVSLVMTDVIHAILLFYLTPVWSTIAGWLIFGERMGPRGSSPSPWASPAWRPSSAPAMAFLCRAMQATG